MPAGTDDATGTSVHVRKRVRRYREDCGEHFRPAYPGESRSALKAASRAGVGSLCQEWTEGWPLQLCTYPNFSLFEPFFRNSRYPVNSVPLVCFRGVFYGWNVAWTYRITFTSNAFYETAADVDESV